MWTLLVAVIGFLAGVYAQHMHPNLHDWLSINFWKRFQAWRAKSKREGE